MKTISGKTLIFGLFMLFLGAIIGREVHRAYALDNYATDPRYYPCDSPSGYCQVEKIECDE